MKIAVFSSHNGSDLQAIIDACKDKLIDATVEAVISNNSNSKALERAKTSHICSYHVSSNVFGNDEKVDEHILEILEIHKVDLVFLAGYLKKIGEKTLKKYHNRIFNIHPSLLPKYGGKGMYGINVHNAVIAEKESISGITIHRVNGEYDEGEIVAQTIVNVSEDDTPESLAQKILEREHTFLVEVLSDIINGKIVMGSQGK